MYVQGEYTKDWERVGDEERVPDIFRIFEPPQNTWDIPLFLASSNDAKVQETKTRSVQLPA
jgi:hypothetical protein